MQTQWNYQKQFQRKNNNLSANVTLFMLHNRQCLFCCPNSYKNLKEAPSASDPIFVAAEDGPSHQKLFRGNFSCCSSDEMVGAFI